MIGDYEKMSPREKHDWMRIRLSKSAHQRASRMEKERDEARQWAAIWKRAAKFNRRGWLNHILPGLFRDWRRRRMVLTFRD